MEWTPNQVVAYNLQRIRVAKEMTQEEACRATALYLPGGGWSRAVWSAAERSTAGKRIRNFDADAIVGLAEGLNVPLLSFFLPPAVGEIPLDGIRGTDAAKEIPVARALDRAWAIDQATSARIGQLGSVLGSEITDRRGGDPWQLAAEQEIRGAMERMSTALGLVGRGSIDEEEK
jgi:transcriptional regulator with XRE-family HTH domain